MPLSPIQSRVLRLLASNRSPDSHLAGATGVLLAARSTRLSDFLDLAHDTEGRKRGTEKGERGG